MAADDKPDPFALAFVVLIFGLIGAVWRSRRRQNRSAAFIDTHVHLWDRSNLPPWLSDPSLKAIAETKSVEHHEAAAGADLAWSVYMEVDVPPDNREEEAKSVVSLCCNPRNRLAGAVIGAPIVDGTLDEFDAYARRWAAKSAVKGVRQVLHTQPKCTCLRADVVAKAVRCGELGLVFELCMRCDELDDAAMLATKAPGTRFVLDHCGGHHQLTADAPASKRKAWEGGIAHLARLPNVWCKLSGLLGAQGGTFGKGMGAAKWSSAEQLRTMRYCLRAFPTNRLLVGGDWPVCTLTAPLPDFLACVHQLLEEEKVGPSDRVRVLRQNAEEVYRL